MLVLMLFYIFYILVFKFLKKEELIVKVSSIIAIIGSINLPIIKYSVEWWTTLHQPASIKITGSSSYTFINVTSINGNVVGFLACMVR